MNLEAMPIINAKKEESVHILAEVEHEKVKEEQQKQNQKHMLLPSQIHKISAMVALLAQQRERLLRLQQGYEDSNTAMIESFDWKTQLLYEFDESSRGVNVKVNILHVCN